MYNRCRRLWHRLTCSRYIDTLNYAEWCQHSAHNDGGAGDGTA